VQRGEVWEYDPVMRRDGRSTLRLILSADGWVADPEHRIVHGVRSSGPAPRQGAAQSDDRE